MNKLSAYNLARSFVYAFQGVARSFWHERNLRIHLFISAYILYFSRYFKFSRSEYAVLFIAIGLVVACELINTAVEAAVDLSTSVYSDLAKTAKDAAAGAVLVSSSASAAVGFIFFWQPDTLLRILSDVLAAPFVWSFLIGITIFLVAWPEHRQLVDNGKKINNIKENK